MNSLAQDVALINADVLTIHHTHAWRSTDLAAKSAVQNIMLI
jgi:hypothetical protein